MKTMLVTLAIAALTQFSSVAADVSKVSELSKAVEATKSAEVSKASEISKASANADAKVQSADVKAAQSSKININTATETELKLLKGIGDAKAKAIVEYRKQYGQFATIEDLTKVSGIGGKVLEDNRHLLTL